MSRWSKNALILGFGLAWSLMVIISGDVGAKERVLTLGDLSPVTNMDPASSTMAQHTMFYRNIFQGLLRYKFNSAEIEGDLAKSWTVSKDGLVYTFKLRDNILWHKGFGKVTAQDVKFSFERVVDPQTRSPFAGEVNQTVKEVKIVDDYTLEIHLKRPDAVFLHKCTRPKPVAIVSKRAVEKYGKDFPRNPIGSGPFVFESMTREQVVLTANKDYFEGPPKIDRMVNKIIPDIDTLIMVLEKGQVDLIWVSLPKDKPTLDRIRASGCQIKRLDRGAWHMYLLNPKVKPLSDVRVRRAIAHAIDRTAIIEHVLGGYGEKLDSLVPKGYFGHTEEGLRRYDFDLKKAKELLAEAGYPNGFEIAMDTWNSMLYLPIATVLQGQLEKAGIKLRLEVTDQPSFMKKIGNATAETSIYMPVRVPDADIPLTNFFHGAGFSPGTNLMRYNNVDREIDEARSEADPNKRMKMYQGIQKKLMEDLPAIPLFMVHYLCYQRPHVAGIPDRDPVWGIDLYPIYFVEKR